MGRGRDWLWTVVVAFGGCYESSWPPPSVDTEEPCWGDSVPCCEDCFCDCFDGFWRCTERGDLTQCTQQGPELPDDEGTQWSCWYEEAVIVCSGQASEHPLAGEGGWDCVVSADRIECRRETEPADYPDGDGPWDCTFDAGASARLCVSGPIDDWSCEPRPDGETCRKDHPALPDGGDWDCYRAEDRDVCAGDHFPEDDGSWDCQMNGELVICSADADVPDREHEWECVWAEGAGPILCESPGSSEPPAPTDGHGCFCTAGAVRYCDEPQYSLWGQQSCEEHDGRTHWTQCLEAEIPLGCEPGGRDALDYDWDFRGGYWDGQVPDPDRDGSVQFAPEYWYNPAAQDCAIRQGFCVQDMWDFDRDGDIQETIGEDCSEIEECR